MFNKITKLGLFLFLLVLLQACNSVPGPQHIYAGQPQAENKIAHLRIPAAITLTKIDNKTIKVPSIEEGYYDIFLLPGVHRIDFKYELVWGDNVSSMLIHSDEVGIESRFYAGKIYELTYKVPTDQDEAYHMAMVNEFKAHLVEKGTDRVVASRSVSELNEFSLGGANVMTNRITPNTPGAVAAESSSTVTAPVGMDADTAAREDAVKRLKFWWLMANDKERKQFKEWMKALEEIK